MASAQEAAKQPITDPSAMVKALSESMIDAKKSRDFFTNYSLLTAQLEGKEPKKAIDAILAAKAELLPDGDGLKSVSVTADRGKAARMALELTRSYSTVKRMGKGRVVFGTLKVADGKLEPDLVLAQMMIQPDGWFCTEIGDSAKPLSFRSAGYQMLDVKIPADQAVSDLGTVVIEPVKEADLAKIKGKVLFQGPQPDGSLQAMLNYSVPRPNTPTGGYSPRKRWPQPQPITLQKDGQFEAKGLTPGNYSVNISSSKHENFYRVFEVKAAESVDAGTLSLKTTDLGFYIGKPTPKAGHFPWEKDMETALKRAMAENKPMMIMMTATWCGPCKMLEQNTLSDGWIQQFMKDFVVVQAYEVEEINTKYNVNAYPTLVFTDKTGKEAHRTMGYQPAVSFAGNILKARKELKMAVDTDLKKLELEKIISPPVTIKRIGG
jgi:thioredoxin-related protein